MTTWSQKLKSQACPGRRDLSNRKIGDFNTSRLRDKIGNNEARLHHKSSNYAFDKFSKHYIHTTAQDTEFFVFCF